MVHDPDLQQKIARRKEKLFGLIRDQEARLAALNPNDYKRHQDYLRVVSQFRNKLKRLKQELQNLEFFNFP